MRGESAFSVRADDWRRLRYWPPDGAIDYLALFLNAFSAPRQPRQLCGSKRLSAGSAIPAPARLIEGGLPTEATVAQVLVSKYADHLPLAQFRGCFFEDDAGRAEDKRTCLSCPDRQAALTKQCLKRCANYASDTTHLVCTGSYPNTVWHSTLYAHE